MRQNAEKMLAILLEHPDGPPTAEQVEARYGIKRQTYYHWKRKLTRAGLDLLRRSLEQQDQQAELIRQNELLKKKVERLEQMKLGWELRFKWLWWQLEAYRGTDFQSYLRTLKRQLPPVTGGERDTVQPGFSVEDREVSVLEEKKVRDIMVAQPDSFIVGPEHTMRHVVASFARYGGDDCLALVVKEGQVIGLLTVMDILQAIQPPYTRFFSGPEVYWDGLFSQRVRNVSHLKVWDFMRPVVAVGPDDPLMKVSNILAKHKTEIVPVMDGDKLVGVVRVQDMFRTIAEVV
ncbi:MAG: CBS domain-containing protein [Bacillota bacterium]|nr:CBS domain-containing protein [Bacillota bacterium]